MRENVFSCKVSPIIIFIVNTSISRIHLHAKEDLPLLSSIIIIHIIYIIYRLLYDS